MLKQTSIRKSLLTAVLSAGFVAVAAAQPAIGTGGVLNAASNALSGLPNSAIAQGSIFLVYGTGLGPPPPTGAPVTYAPFPLPKVVPAPSGTSIRETVGNTAVDALMIYTSPAQIAAILPSQTPVGAGQITVSYAGATSAPAPIQVVANSFGIFTLNEGGSGPAAVQNYISPVSFSVNTLTTPAKPGQTLILYGTGLGAVTFDESRPAQAGNVGAGDFELDVAGIPALVSYHGRSSCCSGLDQINFQVPNGADGCYVPVWVRVGGIISNFTTISVSPSGQACTDPTGFGSSDLQKLAQGVKLKAGIITLSHTTTLKAPTTTGFGGARMTATGSSDAATEADSAVALFFGYDSGIITSQGLNRTPSPGSCMVFTAKGNSAPADPYHATPLDAGVTMSLKGGPTNQPLQLAPLLQSPGIYIPGVALVPGFVGNGRYTAVNGFGGHDVQGFAADATFGNPVLWSNQSGLTTVIRSQPLQITWIPGSPGDLVEITGTAPAFTANLQPLSVAAFTCLAHSEDGQFTVPTAVLQSLPPNSPQFPGIATGKLGVAGLTFVKFGGGNLDLGLFIRIMTNASPVIYQ
ncbi:MAG TPA: hypothetical protein VNH83_31465 [Bryobacteraceae bacterium]|nr:hypothetical protein [Bryobacteraceae bacterium]